MCRLLESGSLSCRRWLSSEKEGPSTPWEAGGEQLASEQCGRNERLNMKPVDSVFRLFQQCLPPWLTFKGMCECLGASEYFIVVDHFQSLSWMFALAGRQVALSNQTEPVCLFAFNPPTVKWRADVYILGNSSNISTQQSDFFYARVFYFFFFSLSSTENNLFTSHKPAAINLFLFKELWRRTGAIK